jgi:hypothetical protein
LCGTTGIHISSYLNNQFWSSSHWASPSDPAEVLEKAPGFAEAWHKRSIAYFAQKNFKEAVEDCRKARWIWNQGNLGNWEEPRKLK